MFLTSDELAEDLDRIEEIEKASTRLVFHALNEFSGIAVQIWQAESDQEGDIGEDITREALDRIGVSRMDRRLFGKIDYKKARYVFHPSYAAKQALMVDSKAERGGVGVARIQTAQTSMRIRQVRNGMPIDIAGSLPTIYDNMLTTSIFVKYGYEVEADGKKVLETITIAAIPNGLLQARYNPTAVDTIWQAGPNAPTLDEAFRTRLSFRRLKAKASWRVQRLELGEDAEWDD